MITIVDETGSTNADLLGRANSDLREGEVLIARHQTAGRGRQGRVWLDQPDAALLMSISLRPPVAVAPLIPLVLGTAVVRAMSSLGVPVGLKWPNDVLAPDHGERKLAGILAEAATVGSDLAVVVGMGMNLEFSGPMPAEVADRAVDLALLLDGRPLDRAALVLALLTEFENALVELETGGSALALDHYRDACLTLGRRVRFETGQKSVEGRAIGIDPTGGLIIENEKSLEQTVLTAGDAHHLR